MMVQAAPNKTIIKFEVLDRWQSKNVLGRIEIKLKILPFDYQEDLRFLQPGESFDGFTFEDHDNLKPGRVLIAEGEYIGGAGYGKVHLQKIRSKEE